MSAHTLVAELGSAAAAKKLATELIGFLTKVAKEIDKAKDPDVATPAALAFGKKYGVRWEEPLAWGDDARLAGNEPEVGTLDRVVVVFHDNIAGGFGAELPAVLAKAAGGKVRAASQPPIVIGEVPLSPKTTKLDKLAAWFEQRLGTDPLGKWTAPPWSRRRLGFGSAADVQFVVDRTTCTFALPLPPTELADLATFVASAGGTLRMATPADLQRLSKREHAAMALAATTPAAKSTVASKSTATKPAAIPTTPLVIERVDAPSTNALMSANGRLYALLDDGVTVDGKRVPGLALDKQVTSLAVAGDTLWIAGAGLWRFASTTLTAMPMPAGVDPDGWGSEFLGVGVDASGVVWAGRGQVVSVRDGKVVHETAFGKDARIKAIVTTELGVLLLTFVGTAYRGTKRLAIRGKGHLSAACVTPRGTLIVVGSGAKWSAEIYRSEDGGATFKPVRVAKLAPLLSVAALPDGRVVAGGNGLLLASTDDGKTWKPVKLPDGVFVFERMCTHGDAIVAGRTRVTIR